MHIVYVLIRIVVRYNLINDFEKFIVVDLNPNYSDRTKIRNIHYENWKNS